MHLFKNELKRAHIQVLREFSNSLVLVRALTEWKNIAYKQFSLSAVISRPNSSFRAASGFLINESNFMQIYEG